MPRSPRDPFWEWEPIFTRHFGAADSILYHFEERGIVLYFALINRMARETGGTSGKPERALGAH